MVNLCSAREHVKGYIDLRNRYTDELMTKPITVESTEEWLRSGGGLIHIAVECGSVVSAVIVHKRREVTIFSDKAGVGNTLLAEAEAMAQELGFCDLWARVEENNIKAHDLFLRIGYTLYDGVYRKVIVSHKMGKKAEDFPLMIVLSFSYVCNARCPNCPYNNSDIRSGYKDDLMMSPEVFTRIADEAGSCGAVLRLSGGGEPFLHQQIVWLTRYATDKGCKVSIITNGSRSVMNVLDVADMIEFSVDAGTKEEYAIARPGLDWDALNAHVAEALEHRKKTALICSVINQKGIDVEKAKTHWAKMDKVQIRKFLTWGYNEDHSADPTPYLKGAEPCPWLFERLNIDSRGDVTYCGEDIAFAHKFSNIMERSIKQIWYGEEFQKIRDAHLKKVNHPEMCLKCPDWKYRTWENGYFKLREHARNNITA